MKSVTMNISLNPELARFARADARAAACDNLSEYFRTLLRQRRAQAAPLRPLAGPKLPTFTPAERRAARLALARIGPVEIKPRK